MQEVMATDASGSPPPELSVVIPAYNRTAVVLTAISSVLEQADENVEVIVVDDGSTDSTASVVEEFCDQRVRVIHASHQGGPDLFSCASIERQIDGSEEIKYAAALGPAFAELHAKYQAGCFGVRAEAFQRSGVYRSGH